MTLPVYGGVVGQTTVKSRMNTAIAGQVVIQSGSLGIGSIPSFVALETIEAGLACYTAPGFVGSGQNTQDLYVQLPHQNEAVMTLAQDITDGSITNVTVNGVALAPIVAVDTDPATNLNQVSAAILAQPNIASVVADPVENSIIIKATAGNPVVVSVATTDIGGLGEDIAVWTVASSTLGKFWGVSVFNQNAMNAYTPSGTPGQISGEATPAPANSPVLVMQLGQVAVLPETTNSSGTPTPITNSSPVYVRTIPTTLYPLVGSFRGDSDGGNAVLVPNNCAQWKYGSATTYGGTAILNVTSPQGG
jgi:hypothetical protein